MTTATATASVRPSLVDGVTNADLAATILRVSMGVLFLAHARVLALARDLAHGLARDEA